MTETEAGGTAVVRRTPDRAILGVIFLLLFVLSYSEEIVSGLFQVLGQGETEEWRIALIVADLAILAWIGLQFPPIVANPDRKDSDAEVRPEQVTG